jgi:phage shock protein C
VQDLVSVAKDQTFDKATRFIDETSKRIESELRYNRVSDEDADEDRDRRRRRRRHRHARARRRYTPQMPRAAGMYRNTEDEKIGGVCSGLARYFGVETWVVRLGALTGLIFLPGVVFPAYWVAYFVMGREPASFADSKSRNSKRRSRRHSRSSKAVEPGAMLSGGAIAMDEPDEFQISPRRSLRNSGADFSQIELRLRRMESFVTSGQYELHKELAKLDDTGSQDHARER